MLYSLSNYYILWFSCYVGIDTHMKVSGDSEIGLQAMQKLLLLSYPSLYAMQNHLTF